jgi:hypothetical protein
LKELTVLKKKKKKTNTHTYKNTKTETYPPLSRMWRSTRTAHTNFPEITQSDSISTALLSLYKHFKPSNKFTTTQNLPWKKFLVF